METNPTGKMVIENNVEQGTLPRGKLFYTIALARAGKSTFCSRWAQGLEYPEDCKGPRAIVCEDSIILELTGERFNSYSLAMVRVIARYMASSLLNRGCNVIYDETNTRKESIRKILEIDINAQYYFIPTTIEVCMQRAIDTEQLDLIPAIRRMNYNLQSLLVDNGGLNKNIEIIRSELQTKRHLIVP